MVIPMVATEYKTERVLIDQGSFANILYWSTYQKLELPPSKLNECLGILYGFAGEQVPIKGVIELETMFGENSGVKSILVLYTIVDVEASYNIIMGQSTLNSRAKSKECLGQFSPGQTMLRRQFKGGVLTSLTSPTYPSTVNVYEHERPHPTKDLKETQVGLSTTHKTKIGVALG
ncbi:hypothetical protein CR513_29946, partial [Mucuna pruriens]